jgi:hypothetical protein
VKSHLQLNNDDDDDNNNNNNNLLTSSAGGTVQDEPWPLLRLLVIGRNPVTFVLNF